MKRKLLLAVAVLALPGLVHALGLGKLQLNSSLNQAFDARIELLSATASELDNLNVGLADTEAFKRAGIDRPYVLSKLKFEVVETENGADYIKITSRDAIREPFLNFLLEASWSNGRLYREYTVLLDPPLYDPGSSSRSSSSDAYDSASSAVDYDSDPVSSDDSPPVYTSSEPSYSGNEYGPTDSSDTLWSIASQVRPDSSVSVQQMMMALLRANPDAFINGNINGLKRGQILTIPSSDEIDSLSSQEAISEVSAQNSSWSGGVADPVERADSMSVSEADDMDMMSGDTDAEMISDDESELRLVAASSDGAAAGGVGGDSAGGADVALVNEQLQAVKQENAELRDRNQEAETIIQDLKRLIELKDNELATLQQQMAGAEVPDDMAVVDTMEEDQGMVEDGMEAVEEMSGAVDEGISEGAEIDEVTMTAEDMMEDAEVVEEELVDEEYDVVDEDMEVVEEDTEVTEEDSEEVVDESAVEEVAAPASPAPAQPESKGMVDQAIAFVMEYLFLIIGAIGAVIVVFMGLLFVSRRKQNAAAEADTEINTTEFPDFEEDAAAETEAPVADAEIESTAGGSEDETILPAEETGAAEDAGENEAVASDEPEEPAAAEEAAPAAPEEPEEEPLAEVNVLIAYEQFDQAEEFVRDAIAGNPDNVEFHAKLLEVFYAANDRKKYEEAAQVLHDKVNGEGPHWEMAQAMWQEMSPSRGLFEEGADEEPAEAPAAEGGGIMDITADDDEAADAGVDFDLGMDGGAEEQAAASDSSDEMLDLTADGEDDDISVLDVTTAARVDASTSDEDLLDVTSAVGLAPEITGHGEDSVGAGEEEPVLDVTGADEEELLDITGGAADIPAEEPAQEEDVLDISHGGGEDLLDVTANANLEADGMEEDLLDVTAVGAGADGEELQEVAAEEPAESDDNSLDFDIGGMGGEEEAAAEAADESEGDEDSNLIDFDAGGDSDDEISLDAPEVEEALAEEDVSLDMDIEAPAEEEVSLDMDIEAPAEEEVSLDMDMDVPAEAEDDDGGVELDLSMDDAAADEESAADDELDLSMDDDEGDAPEISLDSEPGNEDDDLAIDLSIDDADEEAPAADLDIDSGSDDDLEIDLTIDEGDVEAGGDESAAADDIELDMDFDLDIEDDSNSGDDGMDIDMDGTVEMPKLDVADTGIEIDEDDDDDDDDDHTVFVPRSGSTDEQSAEDEVATKLDLAKAYVELGDKDSAKGILDEVMSEGNDEQKQTAQDLLNQLG